MADRPGVMLYFDICPILDTLTPADMGLVLRAALEYAQHGTVPSFEGMAATAWAAIKPKIDKDGENYEDKIMQRQYARYCRTAKSNGEQVLSFDKWQNFTTVDSRSTKTDSEVRNLPTTSSTPSTSTSSTSSTSTSSTTTTNKERGRGEAASPPDPPALADVVSYVKQQGLKMDPEAFIDYYAACGWMTPKGPVIDWKALARNWARREKKGNESDVKSNRLPGGKWHLQTDTGE